MRRKFFLIVFSILLVTLSVVSVLQQAYFAAEHRRLIDQQLETVASSLIASGLSLELIDNLESTDDLIHDLLGDERVDSLINIYDTDGEVLARNYSATLTPLKYSPNEQWQSYVSQGKQIRVLNLQRENLIVQVGRIIDPMLSRANPVLNRYFFAFVIAVSMLTLVAAYMSSQILFAPIRRLAVDLESMSTQLDHKLGQSLNEFVIGPELQRLAKSKSKRSKASKDEFEILCMQLERFLNKLEDYTRSFNAQAAILTHELKTPLTILKNYLEELRRAGNMTRAQALGQSSVEEIDRLTTLINGYLQWSVLVSNPAKPTELYAIKLGEAAERLVMGLNSQNENRIQLSVKDSATVFAIPYHLEQLMGNILSNALAYSPDGSPVECIVEGNLFCVSDKGQGIPKLVLEHLGQPFNRGQSRSQRSSGLGLAWIHALAEKYKWELKIDSTEAGTKICVRFA